VSSFFSAYAIRSNLGARKRTLFPKCEWIGSRCGKWPRVVEQKFKEFECLRSISL